MRYDEPAIGIPKPKVIEALVAEGARVVNERYPLQHQQPVYRRPEFWSRPPEVPAALPVCETLREQIIQLPNFATCEERVVAEYITAFEKVWANLPSLV
jgi:dTDP-4-amino-4,6-dideoxygalactose transaminase